MNNTIFVSGFFNDSDLQDLNELKEELSEYEIALRMRNLLGGIYNSALDFADLEIIAFAYEMMKQFIYSGGYDVLKYFIVNIWYKINKSKNVPFTIGINGIPTVNGPENIKCKISEQLSKKQREIVIDRTFELAKQIEEHQFELQKRSLYYDAFDAHLFRFDSTDETLKAIDVADEVRKKTQRDSKQ